MPLIRGLALRSRRSGTSTQPRANSRSAEGHNDYTRRYTDEDWPNIDLHDIPKGAEITIKAEDAERLHLVVGSALVAQVFYKDDDAFGDTGVSGENFIRDQLHRAHIMASTAHECEIDVVIAYLRHDGEVLNAQTPPANEEYTLSYEVTPFSASLFNESYLKTFRDFNPYHISYFACFRDAPLRRERCCSGSSEALPLHDLSFVDARFYLATCSISASATSLYVTALSSSGNVHLICRHCLSMTYDPTDEDEDQKDVAEQEDGGLSQNALFAMSLSLITLLYLINSLAYPKLMTTHSNKKSNQGQASSPTVNTVQPNLEREPAHSFCLSKAVDCLEHNIRQQLHEQ
ncbi:hypothetical protein EV714DRAFT_278006 [Schizophyllum commune]